MMSETYVECLVKKKTSSGMMFLRMLTIAMAVAFLFAGLFLFILQALLVGLAMAVAASGLPDCDCDGSRRIFCLYEYGFGIRISLFG